MILGALRAEETEQVAETSHPDTRHDLLAETGEGVAGVEEALHDRLGAGARVHQQRVVVALGGDHVVGAGDADMTGVHVDRDGHAQHLDLDGVGRRVALGGADLVRGLDVHDCTLSLWTRCPPAEAGL